MLKKILCILSVFVILPAFSGELEDAAKIHDKIFLYLYAKDCSYCVKFNPVYNNISQKYGKNCKFLKINADTEYGMNLMRASNALYVPFVVMLDNASKTAKSIKPECLLSYVCTQKVVENFIK